MSATAHLAPASRLLSLDAFRGLTIAGMILVNNPGTWSSIYPPLQHAAWHGWTVTDLIFPFFLFIVGVSMVFSFAGRMERGAKRSTLVVHVLRRSAIIIALGFFLHLFPFFNVATMRYPGVLQRIGVCYFFAACIYLAFRKRGQIAAIVVLLAGYWALMMLVPVPGYGAGRLDPDGNLAAYVDRALMSGHLWKPTWDPEGLLSTLPAIATTLLGALAGAWLRSDRTAGVRGAGLAAAGAGGLVLGLLLDLWFPINKNLWTSSYVVFTAGFGALLLAVCYFLMDIRGWRRWAQPFVVYGSNAIIVFVLSGLMAKLLGILKITQADGREVAWKTWIFQTMFLPLASPVNASLLFALAYVAFWLAAMWVLYRRRIFLRI